MNKTPRSLCTKQTLPPTLFAFAALAVLASGPLPAQEPTASVRLEPSEVEVGERFRVTIEVTGVRELEDVILPTGFEFGGNLFRAGVPFATGIERPETGEQGGSVTFSYSLTANRPGSFDVGPFELSADGRELRTEPATLVIKTPDPSEVSVRARLDPAEVKVGEWFELIVDVTHPHLRVEMPVPPDVSSFARGPGFIRRDGGHIFRFVALTPGTHEIGPVEIPVGEDIHRSEPVTLVVLDAHRDIEARVSLNTERAWVGGEFVLMVEVAGVSELGEPPVLPDMSAFAKPLRGGTSGGSADSDGYTAYRTYQYRATAPGEFEIGPAQVTIGGQTVLTNPIRLTIEAAPTEPVIPPEDLRIATTVEKLKVFVGEPVMVSYRVLSRGGTFRQGEWSAGDQDTLIIPLLDDFQALRLESSNRDWWKRISVDGRLYRAVSTHRVAFLPLRQGEVAIAPAEIVVQVNRRKPDSWDDYDRSGATRHGEWTPITLVSDAVLLEVEPLPALGRPESFRGHVGRLEATSWVDRTELQVGETLTLRIRISGHGHLQTMPAPEIPFPVELEVSGPEIDHTDLADAGDLQGSRLYVYQLVAQREGIYRIPALEVSWFDPESESYGTSATEPFDITVTAARRE